MHFNTLGYRISLACFAVLGLVLANLSLTNLLGFEFCAILALAISFVSPYLTIRQVKGYQWPRLWVLFGRSFGLSSILLLIPLFIITLNALRIKNCDFGEGLLFFILLPMISCLHSVSAGLFFGVRFRRYAYLKYLGYLVISYSLLLWNLIFDPPVFAYHATFGYFPGPIYDEKISITTSLLWARGTTIILSLIFLCSAHLTVKLQGRQPTERRKRETVVLLIGLVSIFLLIYQFRGDLAIRPTRSYIEKKLGGKRETDHFLIFYQTGSIVEREIDAIITDHEFRYAQLTSYLQTQPKKKIRSYIYTNADQKKRLMGARYTAIEDPWGHGFHINYDTFPHPVLKHEMAHVFTTDWQPVLKVSPKLGLHEGIAVAAEWDEGKLTAHQWSRAMRDLGLAPSIQQIMGFGFWLKPGAKSYTLAGSFVRYLVDQYGIEKMKQVFRRGDFQAVYDRDLATLDREWQSFLDTVNLTDQDLKIANHRFQRPSVFQKTCAHEVAELSDLAWTAYRQSNYVRAEQLFQQIYRYVPDHPSHLRGLMLSTYRQSEFPRAKGFANQIVSNPKSTLVRVAEAKNLLGNIHWYQGELEMAKSYYQEVVETKATEALERESKAKIHCLEKISNPSKLRKILIGDIPDRLRMTLLHEVRAENPEWALPNYLIGRQLYFEQSLKKAIQYLSSAIGNRSTTEGLAPSLRREAQRLIGKSAYRLQEFDFSRQQFRQISTEPDLPVGTRLEMEDWIQRCDWHQTWSQSQM